LIKKLFLCFIALITLLSVAMYYYSTRKVMKEELPGSVSVEIPEGWNMTESLGNPEEGWTVSFKGANLGSMLTYMPLESAELTYGTRDLEKIVNLRLQLINETSGGSYELVKAYSMKINGHDARVTVVRIGPAEGSMLLVDVTWICDKTNRLFSFSTMMSDVGFEQRLRQLEETVKSVGCH